MHEKDLTTPGTTPPSGKPSPHTTPPDLSEPESITPFPFEPSHLSSPPPPSRRRMAFGLIAACLAGVLLYAVWFVFTARQLRLEIQPEPEKVTVRGALLTPRILDYYLLRPGIYQLTALKKG
ncbi:MAG: hypothetical protein PVJ53_16030, partial [Desulfobacterales bacterium]